MLAGVAGLALASHRHEGAPEAIAKSLGDRLADVLPSDEYTVSVNGPMLDVKGAQGHGSAGMPGMLLLERGTPEDKLARAYMAAAESLRGIIVGTQRQGPVATATSRARFPGAFFDPHVLVTDATIEVWWGGADPDGALVRLRPIPRSEIGL
jgi:hypothetical protein